MKLTDRYEQTAERPVQQIGKHHRCEEAEGDHQLWIDPVCAEAKDRRAGVETADRIHRQDQKRPPPHCRGMPRLRTGIRLAPETLRIRRLGGGDAFGCALAKGRFCAAFGVNSSTRGIAQGRSQGRAYARKRTNDCSDKRRARNIGGDALQVGGLQALMSFQGWSVLGLAQTLFAREIFDALENLSDDKNPQHSRGDRET